MNFAELLQPLTFPCGLTATNRVVMAPMTTWSGQPDGRIHNDECAYLHRRADGLGMVITAACYVQAEGKAFTDQWGCHDDAMLSSLRRAADLLRAQGALAILQIHHGGRMCPASLLGHAPLSASAVAAERPGADTPRAMTEDEILRCIEAFALATRRAILAGFDGVEIHGANTYLPQQFFSPHSNRRDDAWGGDLERRMRFPLAVADAVLAEAARADRPFIVGYRLSPEEVEEPGITLDDTLVLVDALAQRRLDYLHVSVRDYHAASLRDRNDARRPTRVIVERVGGMLPVIGVGMVHTPQDAASVLEDGCDLVALGRILLMEPDWGRLLREGRTEAIRRTLPAQGGEARLTLPTPMYRVLLARDGWLPVEKA
jgi:2,4-dienoyl-CoA reductase-like NADH-dependent reductase (Old Yellow Enzyme family)